MIKNPGGHGATGPSGGKTFPLWAFAAVLLAIALGALVFFFPRGEGDQALIPPEALSKIHQEKARAQKEFSDFNQTPAGKLWQRHPHWNPADCRRIAEGQVFPGMSKEQAAEAVAKIEKIVTPKGEKSVEIWMAEGKRNEKWTLRFEENTLFSVENR